MGKIHNGGIASTIGEKQDASTVNMTPIRPIEWYEKYAQDSYRSNEGCDIIS